MRIVFCWVLLLAACYLVDQLGDQVANVVRLDYISVAMNVGLLMLGAWLSGLMVARVGLPRVSGYLLFGLLVGPFALNLIDDKQGEGLRFAGDLAVSLIALTAGGEMNWNWLKDQIGKLFTIAGVVIVVVWVGVSGVVYVGSAWIPFLAEQPDAVRVVAAVLIGVIAAANSPAIVMAVINESNAEGPVSRTSLAVTICKDMAMVVVFAATITLCRVMVDDSASLSGGFLLAVAVQLIGSLAVGAAIGAAMALYVRGVGAHLVVFIIGCCMLIALVGEQAFTVGGQSIHFEPLLMGLAAGLIMENLWSEVTDPLFHEIESVSLPVFCLFFGAAGAQLQLGVFGEWRVLVVLLILVAVRLATVWGSCVIAGRMVKLDKAWRGRLWLGFVPQAGVALALVLLSEKALGDAEWVQEMKALLLGMVAVNMLLGPLGLRWALARSGEVDARKPASAGVTTSTA